MLLASGTTTPQLDPVGQFFAQYGMLIILLALIVFMFWSSRRRAKRMKAEQEAKALAMVPGVKVLLQGGLYGVLTEIDSDDLSKPVHVEIAPGVVIEVHSQAVLRVVEPETDLDDASLDAVEEVAPVGTAADSAAAADTVDEATPAESDDKPKA